MAEKPAFRIGTLSALVMLAAAFFVDILQFFFLFLNVVPGLGVVLSFFLSVIAAIGFALWFALSGVSYASGKKATAKLLTTISSMTVELTGLLNALPLMTVNTAVIILLSRAEDKEAAKETSAKQAATNQEAQREADAYRAAAMNARALQAANDNEEAAARQAA